MRIWRELAVRVLRKAFRKNQIEHIHENIKTYGNVNNNFHQNVDESNRKLQDAKVLLPLAPSAAPDRIDWVHHWVQRLRSRRRAGCSVWDS